MTVSCCPECRHTFDRSHVEWQNPALITVEDLTASGGFLDTDGQFTVRFQIAAQVGVS